MKKSLAFAAICLAGCMTAAAGCSAKTRNLASLSSNWYTDSDLKGIQPTFTEGNEGFMPESLVYTVTQAEAPQNRSYSAEYADGTYSTKFYAKKISSAELETITREEWREDYLNKTGSNGLVLYCYETALEIPSVTYKFHRLEDVVEERKFENEYLRTISYFLPVRDYLSPVYTRQEIKSAAPKAPQAVSLEGCYIETDRIYESFYNLSFSEVYTKIYDNLADDGNKESEFQADGLNGRMNCVFDVTYLDVVVRATKNMSASLNQTVTLYRPGVNPADFTFTGSAAPLCTDETESDKQLGELQKILTANGLFEEGENEDGTPKKLETVAINVSYNDSVLTGVSQRYWFAAGNGNRARTLMLKYSAPIAYEQGTLEYVLKSVESLPDV